MLRDTVSLPIQPTILPQTPPKPKEIAPQPQPQPTQLSSESHLAVQATNIDQVVVIASNSVAQHSSVAELTPTHSNKPVEDPSSQNPATVSYPAIEVAATASQKATSVSLHSNTTVTLHKNSSEVCFVTQFVFKP